MKKIVIGTNTLTSINQLIYSNHMQWAAKLGRLSASGEYEFIHFAPPRMAIDRMRNMCAKYALDNDADYILFVDDDMILDLNTIESLVDADKDIVMAHTFIRGMPFKPMSFIATSKENNDFKLDYFDAVEDYAPGVYECDAVGFACCLIKTWLLKDPRFEKPYFVTSTHGTEDIYFCTRCKVEIGPHVSIAVDTRVPTYHMLSPEAVGPLTVKSLRNFYKEVEGEIKKQPRMDRGTEYHRLMEQLNDTKAETEPVCEDDCAAH